MSKESEENRLKILRENRLLINRLTFEAVFSYPQLIL